MSVSEERCDLSNLIITNGSTDELSLKKSSNGFVHLKSRVLEDVARNEQEEDDEVFDVQHPNGEVRLNNHNNHITNGGLRSISDDDTRRVVVMKCSRQVKEIHTIIWDGATTRQDFIFYADRLIRMVIEEGLNQLPFTENTVKTHTGVEYKGCSFYKGICGVSIVRSGEAMEKGLRECCRSIRIGKIILKKDEESDERSIIYARFPPDIHKRKVLLMYPILLSGGNVTVGVDALMDNGVKEEDIYILTLFATPQSLEMLFTKHPNVLLLTTEVNQQVPVHFGDQYFGTQ